MTTTIAPAPQSSAPAASARTGRGPLVGTLRLLRFMLRRDRIRFFGWTLGLTMLLAYFANVLQLVFPTAADLASFSALSANPAAALLMGPGFGDAEPSLELFLAGTYGLYLIIGAALMSLLTVVRHTRLEEQSGRAELVRAAPIGRHAPLTAAIGISVLMNLTVAVLMGALLTALEFDAAGSFVFGASVGAAGLAFTGIAAATAQLTAFSRTAAGLAGAVLGASFLVRGLGDMSAAQGATSTGCRGSPPSGGRRRRPRSPTTPGRRWRCRSDASWCSPSSATPCRRDATSVRDSCPPAAAPPAHRPRSRARSRSRCGSSAAASSGGARHCSSAGSSTARSPTRCSRASPTRRPNCSCCSAARRTCSPATSA
ncbi:hypothetical protein GCM10025870_14610 [Agromyces marinus]|uniref:ABC-2 type transport system permease protein n=1 Tax=Agromyces marinus TaxID=1389020 RepID=A0ABM8H0W1_9MICO|nr:hypothetical protein [Agromyces marinus]BDZ54388.1 hypothetical protein GCM10025870_14610 [Agromyces marinus]